MLFNRAAEYLTTPCFQLELRKREGKPTKREEKLCPKRKGLGAEKGSDKTTIRRVRSDALIESTEPSFFLALRYIKKEGNAQLIELSREKEPFFDREKELVLHWIGESPRVQEIWVWFAPLFYYDKMDRCPGSRSGLLCWFSFPSFNSI